MKHLVSKRVKKSLTESAAVILTGLIIISMAVCDVIVFSLIGECNWLVLPLVFNTVGFIITVEFSEYIVKGFIKLIETLTDK